MVRCGAYRACGYCHSRYPTAPNINRSPAQGRPAMIPPPWAITLWSSEGSLYAQLPAIRGLTSHQIRVPLNDHGLKQILAMLEARGAASRLGEKGDPTQHHVDKALA